jgi:hypothetical protein
MTCHGKLIPIADLPAPSESEITATIRDYLRLIGCKHTKLLGGLGAEVGRPDILGCLPPHGRMLALEVKKPGGKLSEAQRQQLREYAEAGAVCVVATSLDDVRAVLEPLGLARVTVEAP